MKTTNATTHYTATVSYCQHTGIKIIIGTEFQQTFLRGKFIKANHWVFDIGSHKLHKLLANKFDKYTDSERYLLLVAYLKSLGALDTSTSPLLLDGVAVDKLQPKVFKLLAAHRTLIAKGYKLPALPVYKVVNEDCDDVVPLLHWVQLLVDTIESASFSITLTGQEKLSIKLDDELELEQELSKILNNYNAASKTAKVSKQLGKWTIRQLKLVAPQLTENELRSIYYYILCNNTTLDEELLHKYIALLNDVMPLDELNRERTLTVITHLKSKLNMIYKDLENYGFDLLEEDELLIGSDKSKSIKLKSKKIKSSKGSEVIKPVTRTSITTPTNTLSALDRMLAKFGK